MKQYYIRTGVTLLYLFSFVWLLYPVMPAQAANVTGATYYGTVQVINNGTANTTGCSSNITNISVANFVDGGYVGSASNATMALLTSSGADIAFQPGFGNNTWMTFVNTIAQDGLLNYVFYTGNITGGKIRYFPEPVGNMTTTDSANLELGTDWLIEQAGYIDTTSGYDKNLVYKEDSFRLWVSNSTDISAIIYGSQLSPNGFNDPDAAWINEPQIYDNNIATFATDNAVPPGAWTSWLELTSATNDTCSAIRYYHGASAFPDMIDVDLWDGDSWETAVDDGVIGTNQWHDFTFDAIYNVTQARVRLHNGDAGAQHILAYEFDFWYSVRVTNTGITSGEHTVQVGTSDWANGDILHFSGNVTSNVDCGGIHDAAAKLWVSMWFKLDSLHQAGSGHKYLFGKWLGLGDRLDSYLDNSSGSILFVNRTGAVTRFALYSTETSWAADTWYHAIFSISSANGARLRVDNGAAVTSANTTAGPNGGNFVIGSQYDGAAQGHIGEIANVIVGTDDLTAGEESDLYNNIFPSDAVNIWYIDEGTGTTITDYGSGGNDGTADSACTWEASSYTTSRTGRPIDFLIGIDGTRIGTNKALVTVPDNANDWVFLENAVMPYMEYHRITIGGVLRQYIYWEYGATFTDQSGNSHDATPAFAVDSSDADVTASLLTFLPVSEAQAPAYSIATSPDLITTAPNLTSDFSTTISPTIPGADVITDAAASSSTPAQLPWLMITGFAVVAMSMVVSYMMRNARAPQSVLVKMLVVLLGMGALVGTGVYDFWMIVFFLLPAIAIGLASRPQETLG